MKHLASFDLGSTSTKGILVDQQGRILAEDTIPVQTYFGEDGRIEQNPEEWWESFLSILQRWWEKGIRPDSIALITFSGQMQDCIPIDQNGTPVYPAILYSDARAASQAARIVETIGAENVTRQTGNHFDGSMPLAKILWLKEQEPDIFNQIDKVLISSKDYIIRHLTNEAVTDPTTGATTGMMSIKKRKWMAEWFDRLDLPPALLPELKGSDQAAGTVSRTAAQKTGLPEGTPVLCGAGDAGATTMGAGAIHSDELYAYLGTTGWIAVPTEEVVEQGKGIFHLAHLQGPMLISIAPLLNAGNAHRWAMSVFAKEGTENGFAELEAMIENTKPGANGVLFLPYLNGERCPIQDPNASGSFIGIRMSTTKEEMARAVLEGVAMAIRQILELMTSGKKLQRLCLIGGGTRSKIWCQMMADICQVQVYVPTGAEYLPSLGAAAPGFVRLGWANDYRDFIEMMRNQFSGKVFEPQLNYDQTYSIFKELYPSLERVFSLQRKTES